MKRSAIKRSCFKSPRESAPRAPKSFAYSRRRDARPEGLKQRPYHSVETKRGLKDALDVEVSIAVRTAHPSCVLCGESDWQMLTNGHLFKRTKEATRFDTEPGGNCSTLCKSCNDRDNREHQRYVDWFKARYGAEAYEALEVRARSKRSFEPYELRAMLESLRSRNAARKAA